MASKDLDSFAKTTVAVSPGPGDFPKYMLNTDRIVGYKSAAPGGEHSWSLQQLMEDVRATFSTLQYTVLMPCLVTVAATVPTVVTPVTPTFLYTAGNPGYTTDSTYRFIKCTRSGLGVYNFSVGQGVFGPTPTTFMVMANATETAGTVLLDARVTAKFLTVATGAGTFTVSVYNGLTPTDPDEINLMIAQG